MCHEPIIRLQPCSQTVVRDTKFCLSKKLMLKLKGLTSAIQHLLPQFSRVIVMSLLSPLYLFVINVQSYQI